MKIKNNEEVLKLVSYFIIETIIIGNLYNKLITNQ